MIFVRHLYTYGIVLIKVAIVIEKFVPTQYWKFVTVIQVQSYSRDGHMTVTENGGSKPNYYPNSFEDLPRPDASQPDVHPYKHEGGVVSRAPPRKWSEQDDYEQPRALWQLMTKEDQEQTAKNIAGHIQGAKDFIIQRQLAVFKRCDPTLAEKVEEMLAVKKNAQDPYTMVA